MRSERSRTLDVLKRLLASGGTQLLDKLEADSLDIDDSVAALGAHMAVVLAYELPTDTEPAPRFELARSVDDSGGHA